MYALFDAGAADGFQEACSRRRRPGMRRTERGVRDAAETTAGTPRSRGLSLTQ